MNTSVLGRTKELKLSFVKVIVFVEVQDFLKVEGEVEGGKGMLLMGGVEEE